MRRWGLTATFAIVSLLAMVAVGTLLIVAIGQQARTYALDEAVHTAEAYLTSGVRDVATLEELAGRDSMPGAARREIDQLAEQPDDSLRAVRLWTVDSQLVYASDADTRQGLFPDNLRLDRAIDDSLPAPKVVDEFPSLRTPGAQSDGAQSDLASSPVLSVYLPLGTMEDGQPAGAAEVVLDYAGTEAALSDVMRLIAILVVGGLALLWLLLFRTVSNASRRLRKHAFENARLALLDPLTGLPNRRLLTERLDREVVSAKESGRPMALLILDVDGFKDINDTMGHDVGDKLLVEVARRIREVARDSDTVARLGGDEFAVLMPGVSHVDKATALARRILDQFSHHFDLDTINLHVDASIGVAVLPDHAEDQTTLMRHADVAMYAAKRAKIGYAVYSSDRDHNSTARLTLMADLRSALSAEDQLALHYQPKIDLRTGRVAGVEALLRWNHPVHGFMPPDAFIPLAEQTGMVTDLTQWVLVHAIAQVEAWQRLRGGDPLPVAVNLSARNLHEPDLTERVRVLLDHAHVNPASLEIEITESAIPGDPGQAMTLIEELADLGVPVAIDDFGIGNTSISQLRSFPLRTLKIDRSFISPLDSDPGSVVLVRAIVDLAHEFGIAAIAEGVEVPAVATTLRELGCDLAQGYLWSKAVPADEVLGLVERINEGASTAHHQWSLA